MTSFSERWVGLYTRGLPAESRDARLDEIASDVFEQRAGNGASERGVRMSIAGRTLRGMPGDLMWRFEEGRAMSQQQRALSTRPTGLRAAWATVTQSWFTPLAVLVGVFNLLMALYVILDENGKMPGQAIGPVLLCLFAVAMFTGLWLRWRAQLDGDTESSQPVRPSRRSATTLRVLAVVAVLLTAVGVVVSGAVFLVGALLLAVVVVLSVLRRRHSSRPSVPAAGTPARPSVLSADVLIVVATLPSLALFWAVIPPILAIAVIGGVIGTGPSARRAAAA